MVFWLPIRQSRYLYYLGWLQSGCAMFALLFVNWPFALQVVVAMLIAIYACRRTSLPQALIFNSHELVVVAENQSFPARLGSKCYCGEFWVALRIDLEKGSLEQSARKSNPRFGRWLLLLPDSSSTEGLRKLQIYLRWHARL